MVDTCIIDFDGTAYNTIQAICKIYEDDYGAYQDFQPVSWEDIHTWDFTELTLSPPFLTNLYFNQKRFFDYVEPMRNFNKVLDQLRQDYKIVFCSIGDYPNIKLKEAFLKFRYPLADYIGIDMNEYEDKSHIDMSNAIFIDDSASMLETSNAPVKICFGKKYPWNDGWQGAWCPTWEQVKDFIYYVVKNDDPEKEFCHHQANVSIQGE